MLHSLLTESLKEKICVQFIKKIYIFLIKKKEEILWVCDS